MMSTARKIFQNLQGKWLLSRNISGSHAAHVVGTAIFQNTMHENELRYSEAVEISLDEQKKMSGYQHYIYRLENENKLNVYFDDGRLFHSIEFTDAPSECTHKASHYCQPDTYNTFYFFSNDTFQIKHEVNGPKKSYISCTTYSKYC